MENKPLTDNDTDSSLLSAFAWWEKKRLVYNMVLFVIGIIPVLSFDSIDLFDLIGILLYGLLANVFYCLGFFIEISFKLYFKSDKYFNSKREPLFWAGLIFSVCLTAFLSNLAPY